jgi:ATP-binding cassette subfamily C (CFTR/MRP) protein 1
MPNDPDKAWPSSGEIIFNDVKLRYRKDLPYVLKGLSFHIKAGGRVSLARG